MTFKEAIKFSPTDSLEAWLVQYQDFVTQVLAELARRKAHPLFNVQHDMLADPGAAHPSSNPEAVPLAAPKG